VLYSSVQYPYDYGFVPNTLADDPLDGMVLMKPTFQGASLQRDRLNVRND